MKFSRIRILKVHSMELLPEIYFEISLVLTSKSIIRKHCSRSRIQNLCFAKQMWRAPTITSYLKYLGACGCLWRVLPYVKYDQNFPASSSGGGRGRYALSGNSSGGGVGREPVGIFFPEPNNSNPLLHQGVDNVHRRRRWHDNRPRANRCV